MTTEDTQRLLRLDAAVTTVLEGFTGDERKRREHALNAIMTELAIETVARDRVIAEMKSVCAERIAAALNRGWEARCKAAESYFSDACLFLADAGHERVADKFRLLYAENKLSLQNTEISHDRERKTET